MVNKNTLVKSIGVNVVIMAVLLALGFFVGYGFQNRTPRSDAFSENPENVDMFSYWHVWDLLEARYPFKENIPTAEEKLYGSIQGLTSSYGDPYTVFFEPEKAKLFNEDVGGEFSGVGMEVGAREGFLVVIAPLKDSPAEKSGVKAGDIIVSINDLPAAEMYLDEAIQHIRGDKGTQVVLGIMREDMVEPMDISVTRDIIVVPTLETEIVNEDIFKVNFYSFSANATKDFSNAMNEFAQSPYQKLIVDLRNNPGGFLDAAIDTASFFVPQGKSIVVEDFGEGEEELIYRSKGFATLDSKDYEMVILINEGSASASEIFAGALGEYDRAIIVGTQSFGKGSVQELMNLSDGSSIKITVAKWLTPKGVSIEENGLTPDHVVELTSEDYNSDKDPQLDKAIELLR
jgi:carboxyl-terminal processing protease